MNEAALTKKAVLYIRKRGAFVSKIHGGPSQTSGLPDLTGCHVGMFFGIEMKAPGKEGTLTKRQAHILNKIREAGGIASVASSMTQVRDVLDECEEKAEAGTQG